MKKGLVLEGGGLRSLFSEGVFDVLLENDIRFDGAIGVSAGASIGCNFKSKQIGRALRYNSNYSKDKRYISLWSLIHTGDIVGREFSYHVVPLEEDIIDIKTYNENPLKFHAVCTDVETGECVIKELPEMNHETLDWLCASSSMPIVSRPVELDGRKLLDGGIVNSIPLKEFQEMGYERNLVILTQPLGYFKKRTKLMPLFYLFCHKTPKIIKAMGRRHLMYNNQLEYIKNQQELGETLVICPTEPLAIGRLEMKPEKMRRVYELGRKVGLENIERIKAFLNK